MVWAEASSLHPSYLVLVYYLSVPQVSEVLDLFRNPY